MERRNLCDDVLKILALFTLLFFLPICAFADTGIVNVSSLNLREKASKNSDALQTLSKGTKLTILSSSGDWYKVSYGKYRGYVMKKYVDKGSTSSSDKSNNTSSGKTTSQSVLKKLKKIGMPSTAQYGDKGSNVRKLQNCLKILGYYTGSIDGDYGNMTRTAVKEFQKARGLSQDGKAGAGTIASMFNCSKADVLEHSSDNSSSSSANSSSSEKSSSNSKSTSQSDLKKLQKIGMPATTKYGDEGSDVRKLQSCLKVLGYFTGVIDGDYGNMTRTAVKAFQKARGLSQDGKAGLGTIAAMFNCSKSDVSNHSSGNSSSTSSSSNSKKTSASDLKRLKSIGMPTTASYGDSGSNVRKLQRCLNVLGFYNGSIDGDYGSSTRTAVRNFQKARGLSQDGKAGTSTIASMFNCSKNDVSVKTEMLDWFHGGKDVIPKGASFMVKDIRTGKIFKCKRWSGGNHMDSEPYTAADTRIMKSIYGNWTWNRRPILVSYNGHVYAASMNGMPHGTGTISSNNFPGHFCIHFLGSKTHGTKRVDPTHQQCVKTAINYHW